MTSPLVVGLVLGAGVFCIYWSFWPQADGERPASRGGFIGRAARPPHPGRLRLDQPQPTSSSARSCCSSSRSSSSRSSRRSCRSRCASLSWRPRLRSPWCVCVLGVAGPSCVTCGPTSSTTSPPVCAPDWRCPRRCRSSPSVVRRSCAPPSRPSPEDYRATGRFHDCLDRLKDRLSDPVADRIIESLRIAREVGGSDLGRLLRTLSAFLREDARTRAELETRQSWTVNAARLAVAAPWIVLAHAGAQGQLARGLLLACRLGHPRRRCWAVRGRLPGHGVDRAAARRGAGAAMNDLVVASGRRRRLGLVVAGRRTRCPDAGRG